MRYDFDILTQVQFNHSYFSGSVFNGFDVNVFDSTKRTLNNMSLMYKPFKGGFYILYDKNFANKPRSREDVLTEKLMFEFTLELKDPFFYNYTDSLPAGIEGSIYHFHNSLNVSPGVPNPLHEAQFVSEKDLVNLSDNRHHFLKKPFAKVNILVHPQLETQYYIGFAARQTYWRYILMNDYLHHLSNPAIINETDDNVFSPQFDVQLPDAKKAYGFVSADKLTLSQNPSATYRLVENFQKGEASHKEVIRALPIPDVRYTSLIPVQQTDPIRDTNPINYSDIFIH